MSVFYSCPTFQCLYIFQDLLYLLRRECGLVSNTNFHQFLLIHFPCKIAQTRNQNTFSSFLFLRVTPALVASKFILASSALRKILNIENRKKKMVNV